MTNDEQGKSEGKKKKGQGFFFVDRNQWPKVCALGINPAVAYLVMCCGTNGKNHSTTKWSATAVRKYSRLPFHPASKAIKQLIDAKLITQTVAGKKPKYQVELSKEPSWIYLPNTIVTGISKRTPPPIQQILGTNNPRTLQLFIDMYYWHDLDGTGGLPLAAVYSEHLQVEGEDGCDYGAYKVLPFSKDRETNTAMGEFAAPYLDNRLKDPFEPFWESFNTIRSLGLIEWIPHLFTAKDGIVIHPCGTGGEESANIEDQIGYAARQAALAMIAAVRARTIEKSEREEEEDEDGEPREFSEGYDDIYSLDADYSEYLLVPVPRHLATAEMISIARLVYRPHTKKTGKWYGELQESGKELVTKYQVLYREALPSEPLARTGSY